MRAFVITLQGHEYSERVSRRCVETADRVGQIQVERFAAVDQARANEMMQALELRWTWANMNQSPATCPKTGLHQHPYGKLLPKIGCALSHFLLWRRCAAMGEPILILEHDAVFVSRFPDASWQGACQINDPSGATPHGHEWSERMKARGPGIFGKTKIFDDRPDGLAGNSAYVLTPETAAGLVQIAHDVGLWPNDALMCRQMVPELYEFYPFVTRVQQDMSTSSL